MLVIVWRRRVLLFCSSNKTDAGWAVCSIHRCGRVSVIEYDLYHLDITLHGESLLPGAISATSEHVSLTWALPAQLGQDPTASIVQCADAKLQDVTLAISRSIKRSQPALRVFELHVLIIKAPSRDNLAAFLCNCLAAHKCSTITRCRTAETAVSSAYAAAMIAGC